MSNDLVTLGFRADTSGLLNAQRQLDNTTRAGGRLDSITNKLTSSLGAMAATAATFIATAAGARTIYNFDEALKGLQATTNASTYSMARMEEQARSLGATSKFSATEAANAQRFLAMAGLEVNEVLSAAPSILKLATAAEVDLASAADMATNALGGLQLPVSELDRVIDVMAATASSANTNLSQMASALSYAAPVATSAGISLEEASAAIGKLSDNGLQGTRAGTGLLGVIRQLSKPSSEAEKALNAYGLTLQDVNIESNGLTDVLRKVNDAGLDTASMFTIFGSEAAPAAEILASNVDQLDQLTIKLGDAEGAAKRMSDIMGGSMTAGLLGVSSALGEVALQIGDAGLTDAIKSSTVAVTGFIHTFTGMLPEFAEANNLTSEYVQNLQDVSDYSVIAAGTIGGVAVAMASMGIATRATAASMAALNAIMFANPFVLAAGAIAAVTGGLYAARNMTVSFGNDTVQVRDIVTGVFDGISDSVLSLADYAGATYDYLASFFAMVSTDSGTTADNVGASFAQSFQNIYDWAAWSVNKVIASFDSLGKTIGIIAASVYTNFTSAFERMSNISAAFGQDLENVFNGDFSFGGFTSALKDNIANPITDTFSAIKETVKDSFNTDYLGDFAGGVAGAMSGVGSAFDEYIIKARNARLANEELATSEKQLADDINWMLDALDSKSAKTANIKAETDETTKSYQEQITSIDNQITAFEEQALALQMGADAYELYRVQMDAVAANMSTDQIDALIAKTKELQAARNNAMDMQDAEMNYQSAIDSVNDFGGAWSNTGSIIASSIGDAVDALEDYASRMDGINARREKLLGLQKEFKDNEEKSAEITSALAKLDEESSAAKMSALQDTIGLSAQLFSENSKERKALHALEMGFMVAEIALATEKAIVSAVGAVANQGSGDPYSAFGRIAAMIAIMGGVLATANIAFSGGGGGYTAPSLGGTGTVSGDSEAQSESVGDSFELFEDIQIDQLAELRGIRDSLTSLSNGIAQLTQSVLTTGVGTDYSGDLTGYNWQEGGVGQLLSTGAGLFDPVALMIGIASGFKKVTKEVTDSGIAFVSQSLGDIIDKGVVEAQAYFSIKTKTKKWFGLSSSTDYDLEYDDLDIAITSQMADLFGFIGDSALGAVESLGFTLSENMLENFVVNFDSISFEGKTGEEIQEELEAVFSTQSDLIAEYLLPAITNYQEVGEGAFETLQRVAYEQAIFNDALERTGMSFGLLNHTLQIDIAQTIIDMIGGAEKFASAADSYFENFYSESEQFDYLAKSLGDVFDSLGVGMVDTREGFKKLVESLDLTNEADQRIYATLLEINPSMSEYLDYLEDAASTQAEYNEQLASDKLTLQIELLNAQGKAEEALTLTRERELAATDESLHSLLNMIYALEDAAAEEAGRAAEIAAAEALAAESRSLNIELLQLQGESEKALALQREIELAATDESLHSLLEMIYALEDAAKVEAELAQAVADAEALQSASKSMYIQLLEAQGRSEEALALTREQALNDLDPSLRAMQLQIWAEQDLAQAREDAQSALEDQISALESEQSALESLADSLGGVSDSINEMIYGAYDAVEYNANKLDDVLRQARTGDFSSASDVSSMSLSGELSSYATTSEYNYARDVAFNKLAEIADLSESAEEVTQRAIMSINDNIDFGLELSEKQLDAMLAIEKNTKLGDFEESNGFISYTNDNSSNSESNAYSDYLSNASTLNNLINQYGDESTFESSSSNEYNNVRNASEMFNSIVNNDNNADSYIHNAYSDGFSSYESSASNNSSTIFNNNSSHNVVKTVDTRVDNTMLELIKELKADKELAEKRAKEMALLLEKANKDNAQTVKTLKRIELNTYEAIK